MSAKGLPAAIVVRYLSYRSAKAKVTSSTFAPVRSIHVPRYFSNGLVTAGPVGPPTRTVWPLNLACAAGFDAAAGAGVAVGCAADGAVVGAAAAAAAVGVGAAGCAGWAAAGA